MALAAFSSTMSQPNSNSDNAKNMQQHSFQTWTIESKASIQPHVILPLSPHSHKGTSGGRVAVLGGSVDYTGAPYYAATACLQTGCDLSYVWTAQEATFVVKTYSPEFMVSSVYCAKEFAAAQRNKRENNNQWSNDMEQLTQDMVTTVVDLCHQRRLHALVIGPGLGRDEMVLEAIKRIVMELQYSVAMVLDADALYMLSINDNAEAIFGKDEAATNGMQESKDGGLKKRRRIILTPNVMEHQRLFGENPDFTSEALSWARDLVILQKGGVDTIRKGTTCMECHEPGGLKRSGGIGDILSGCTGTLLAWQALMDEQQEGTTCRENHDVLVAWTACCFVKRATKRAFEEKRRAMTAPDILSVLGSVIDEMTSDEH
ncbi:hypothetical protein MPSEU_000924200 [Mayamaea pseudoterrestris]|nr:hypothetical protein MPSEU_000924200 [Mayamaea pseudoterrestris]